MPEKIVLDTNIIVSALLSLGKNSDVILTKVFQGELITCYSQTMLEEYGDVLRRPKFNFDEDVIESIISFIISNGVHIEPEISTISIPDEDDRAFLDVATALGARLVTGNLKDFPDYKLAVSPAGFLDS